MFLALSIVNGLRKPWDELSHSDSDSSDSESELPEDVTQRDDTELNQLLMGIETTITCLFRLSMAI
jgi:hypothetical protein